VLIVVIFAVALGFGVVVLAILGFGLFGQVKRLLTTVEEVQADLRPKLEALRPAPSNARHRA
jgi:hypothetical protein